MLLTAAPDLALQTTLIFYLSLIGSFIIISWWLDYINPPATLRRAIQPAEDYCVRSIVTPVRRSLPSLKRHKPQPYITGCDPVVPGTCTADTEDDSYAAIWADIKDTPVYMWYHGKRLLRFRLPPLVLDSHVKRAERWEREREETKLRALEGLIEEMQVAKEQNEMRARRMAEERKREQALERRRRNVFLDDLGEEPFWIGLDGKSVKRLAWTGVSDE